MSKEMKDVKHGIRDGLWNNMRRDIVDKIDGCMETDQWYIIWSYIKTDITIMITHDLMDNIIGTLKNEMKNE